MRARFIFPLLVLFIILAQCTDEQPSRLVTTLDPVVVSNMTVQLSGRVNSGDISAISEYGFVWGGLPGITSPEYRYRLSKPVAGNDFSAEVSNLKPGLQYYARAYVMVNGALEYGDEKSFVFGGLDPEVTQLSPSQAYWNDTIKISGKNFTTAQTSVLFGSLIAQVLSSTETLLLCLVPRGLAPGPVPVTVKVHGRKSQPQEFQLAMPVISSIDPVSGNFLDQVTITGENFRPETLTNKVRFGSAAAEVVSASRTRLVVKVPLHTPSLSSEISVQIDSQRVASGIHFQLSQPVVSGLTPQNQRIGNTITITGSNFSPSTTYSEVWFGDNKATLTSATSTQLVVTVPFGAYEDRDFTVRVKVADAELETPVFSLSDAWIYKGSLPTAQPYWYSGQGFAIGGFGYGGTGLSQGALREFHRYDPSTNTWNRVADFGGGKRYWTSGFVIGDEAFVGTGYGATTMNDPRNDFYKYSPATDQWTRVADFPGAPTSRSVGYTLSGKGYLCLPGATDNHWQYDPVSNQWTQRASLSPPGMGSTRWVVGAFVLNNRAFALVSRFSTTELYEYDDDGDQWIQKNDVPAGLRIGFPVWATDTHAYILSTTFLEYDITTDSWRSLDFDFRLYAREDPFVFSIGNFLYLGGGREGSFKDFWECDLSRY